MTTLHELFQAFKSSYNETHGRPWISPNGSGGWGTPEKAADATIFDYLSQAIHAARHASGEYWGAKGQTGRIERDYTKEQIWGVFDMLRTLVTSLGPTSRVKSIGLDTNLIDHVDNKMFGSVDQSDQ